MDQAYQIRKVDRPEDAMWGMIGGGIHQYNIDHGGDEHGQPLCLILYGPDDEIAGGLIGETHWDWFYINLMFIKPELRGQGYGSQILAQAEAEARQRGAKHAYLDTFSFQAPEFYAKYGYEVFGMLEDFPAGHQRYYLRKSL